MPLNNLGIFLLFCKRNTIYQVHGTNFQCILYTRWYWRTSIFIREPSWHWSQPSSFWKSSMGKIIVFYIFKSTLRMKIFSFFKKCSVVGQENIKLILKEKNNKKQNKNLPRGIPFFFLISLNKFPWDHRHLSRRHFSKLSAKSSFRMTVGCFIALSFILSTVSVRRLFNL